METVDLNLKTNDELKKIENDLVNEFENQKTIIARAYMMMGSLKQQYDEIEEIINKREGNGK